MFKRLTLEGFLLAGVALLAILDLHLRARPGRALVLLVMPVAALLTQIHVAWLGLAALAAALAVLGTVERDRTRAVLGSLVAWPAGILAGALVGMLNEEQSSGGFIGFWKGTILLPMVFALFAFVVAAIAFARLRAATALPIYACMAGVAAAFTFVNWKTFGEGDVGSANHGVTALCCVLLAIPAVAAASATYARRARAAATRPPRVSTTGRFSERDAAR